MRTATEARTQAVAACADALRRAGEEIQKVGRTAELPCGELADALFAVDPLQETAVCESAFSTASSAIAAVRDERVERTYAARWRTVDAEAAVRAAEEGCERLRTRKENVPDISGFEGLQMACRENMHSARGVYELLEPAPGCDARHLALLEQLAGDAFLATLVTDEKEADRVRRLAWQEGSSCAVAVREEVNGDVTSLTPWLGNFISFEESDPAAVRLLARHLASIGAPQDGTFLSVKTWAFRDRAAPLPNGRPRLIGRKARAAELARQQRAAEENLSAARRGQKAAERELQIAEASERAVRGLAAIVETARNEIREAAENVRRARERELAQSALLARTQTVAEERARGVADIQEELDDLRLKMRAAGVDASLEKRIAAAEKALRQKGKAKDDIQQQIGVMRGRMEALAKTRQARETDAASAQARAETAAAAFADRRLEGETVEACAARFCPDCVHATDFAALREKCVGDARVAETEIGRMIPARLFEAGQATTLSGETVAHVRAVEWRGRDPFLVTSENAAPFARLVAAKRPALYTEGYPNGTVQRFLQAIGDAGVEAEHAGDADFDGFRIADMIGRRLPLRRVVAAEVVRNPRGLDGIPLTAAQTARARRFLEKSPKMPYAEEIALLLARGCWYEQEAFPL